MKTFFILITLFLVLSISVFSQEQNPPADNTTQDSQNRSEVQTTPDGKTIINNYNTYNTYNYYSSPEAAKSNENKKVGEIALVPLTQVLAKKDRVAIGYNFMPSIIAKGLSKAAYYYNDKLIEQNGSYGSFHKTSKDFGLGFSLDIMLTKRIAISADAGYMKLDAVLGSYYFNASSIPWAVGFKVFPAGRGLSGFFLFPKVGGNSLAVNGLYNGRPITYDGKETIKSHGIYASVELGWRIKLFPKSSANWPIRVAIDISLLDIGYYFVPWANKFIEIAKDYEPLVFENNNIAKYKNIHLGIFPRIGFSLIF